MAQPPGRTGGYASGPPKPERINAQFSAMPATECIGAGRLEGWFATPAYMADGRGWGHIQSYCFEGDLFFHLQRSPLLRGINFQKKDPVTYEVIEVNGRCEAVKLLLPRQVEEMEAGHVDEEVDKPAPKDLLGQRVEGIVKSQCQLVAKQHWGFVGSDTFAGQVFWHITENPEMQDIEFEREDIVEFEVCIDEQRGSQVRAKNMKFIRSKEKSHLGPRHLSDRKRQKKEEWKAAWRKAPPPDWDCKSCGFNNFGRNKLCKKCGLGERPLREEWPKDDEDGGHSALAADPGAQAGAEAQQLQAPDAWPPNGDEAWPPEGAEAWQPEVAEAWQQTGFFPQQHIPQVVMPQLPQQHIPQVVMPPQQPLQRQMDAEPLAGKVRALGKSIDGNVQATLALCMGAFEDLLHTQQLGGDLVETVCGFATEVNQVLGDDRNAKHAFSMQLARHPWFAENWHEVRYKPSQNTIEIVPIEPPPAAAQQEWRKRKFEAQPWY